MDVGCKLRVVGSWYSMTGYGIALTKGSKYKEMIDRKIIEYTYSGQLERSQKFWFSGSCQSEKEDSNSEGLGIPQSSSVFILLIGGFIFGFIFFIADHLYHKHISEKVKLWFYELPKDNQNQNKKVCKF